jgi:hypothetical protein
MSIVHNTTLVPTKLELLTSWLPLQRWYAGSGNAPDLARAGGFRLDDPAGEVGIEFMIVTDAAAAEPVAYLVPMTYRGAPLPDAESALIGTTQHGVLGERFVYDGPKDPVFRAELAALVRGKATPQAQSQSDTADPSVQVGALPDSTGADLVRVLVESDAAPAAGEVSVPWRWPEGRETRGIIARAF